MAKYPCNHLFVNPYQSYLHFKNVPVKTEVRQKNLAITINIDEPLTKINNLCTKMICVLKQHINIVFVKSTVPITQINQNL